MGLVLAMSMAEALIGTGVFWLGLIALGMMLRHVMGDVPDGPYPRERDEETP